MKNILWDTARDCLLLLAIPVLFCSVGSCSGPASGAVTSRDVAGSQESLGAESAPLNSNTQPVVVGQDVTPNVGKKGVNMPQTLKLMFFSEQPLENSSVVQFVQQIESLAGVKAVAINGIPHPVVDIKVDFARLEYYGTVKIQHMVSALNDADNIKDFSTFVVSKGPQGAPIRLGDVTQIERRFAPDDVSLRYNGTESASITVVLKQGISSEDIFKSIQKEVLLQPGEYYVKPEDSGYQVSFSLWTPASGQPGRKIESRLKHHELHRYSPMQIIENHFEDAIDRMYEDRLVRVLVMLRVDADMLVDCRRQLVSLFFSMDRDCDGVQPGDVTGIGSINISLPPSVNSAEFQRDILQMLNSNKMFLASWIKTAAPVKMHKVELEVDEERRKIRGIRSEDVAYYYNAALNGIDGVTRAGGKETSYRLRFDIRIRNLNDLLNVRMPAKDGYWIPLRDVAIVKTVPTTTANTAAKPTEFTAIVSPENATKAKKEIESWLSQRNIKNVKVQVDLPQNR